jgi:L-2,4-diaminobutyrate decarboxylase
LAVPIYLALHTLGTDVFGEFVTTMYDRARWFAGLLNRTDNFEVAVPPESNIVCFRYAPLQDAAANNALQRHIRETFLNDGEFYIVQTELNGTVFLRTTLMNPLSTEEVLQRLVARIADVGDQRVENPQYLGS